MATPKLGLKLVQGRGVGAQSPDTLQDGGQVYDVDYNTQHIDDLAGNANGLATLDGTGKVPAGQIPGGGGAPIFTVICGEDIPANAFVCVVDTGDGHGVSLHLAGANTFQIACGFVAQAYTTGQLATVQVDGLVTQPYTGSDFSPDSDEGFSFAYLKADGSGFAQDSAPSSPPNMQQQLGPIIAIDGMAQTVTIAFNGNGTNSDSISPLLNGFQLVSQKDHANGYAGLDSNSNVNPDHNSYTEQVSVDVSAGGLFQIPNGFIGAGVYKLTGAPSVAVVFQIAIGGFSRPVAAGPFTIINATANDSSVGIAGPQGVTAIYTIPPRAQQTFTCSSDTDAFSLAPVSNSPSRIAGLNNVAVGSGTTVGGLPLGPNEKRTVLFTTGGSATQYNLPTATGCKGAQVWFKKVDNGVGVATIAPQGGENIEGAASKTLIVQWKFIILESLDNGVWGIFGSN